MRASRGFTLLEVLVVIVIIAVIVSLAVINIGDSAATKLSEETNRLQTLIRLAADEAVFQGREIGISIEDDAYLFLIFDDQLQQWQPMAQDPIFRKRTLPAGIRLELFLDDQQLSLDIDPQQQEQQDTIDEIPQPQLLLLSSGEMTPFELVFELEDKDRDTLLRGHPNGTVEEVFGEP